MYIVPTSIPATPHYRRPMGRTCVISSERLMGPGELTFAISLRISAIDIRVMSNQERNERKANIMLHVVVCYSVSC